ncbi:MAG: thioredoxin family protein [Bergeyella sp.]|nr:thioredoxin family protein [Bergeyella sp.]
MKTFIRLALVFVLLFPYRAVFSQTVGLDDIKSQPSQHLPKPYNEQDRAEEKIAVLIKKAQKENKKIILQGGGNWCVWCLRFNAFVRGNAEINSILEKNFLYYHLNYSPKNKNKKVFEKYGNPGERYGYPVLLVLDKNGKLIHIQSTQPLEEGNTYSVQKVKALFEQWAK